MAFALPCATPLGPTFRRSAVPQRSRQRERPGERLSVLCQATDRAGDENGRGPVLVVPTVSDAVPHSAPTSATAALGAASLVQTGRRTGGTTDFHGATEALVQEPLLREKNVVLMRHGLSSWNEEGRVQGGSDGSVLSPQGEAQALRCKEALQFVQFDCCFASPITRARKSAEIVWEGRPGPLVFLDCLREANLLFLEGMLNSEAKQKYPEQYRAWREDPANFNVDGVYPVRNLWTQARQAWTEVLHAQGNCVLIVTHKSLLRAMICSSLGMGPERFRAIDVNNGGICTMRVSRTGEPMLEGLNLTAHLQCEAVHYNL